eukprot:4048887-Prymnesium_polylepis.2
MPNCCLCATFLKPEAESARSKVSPSARACATASGSAAVGSSSRVIPCLLCAPCSSPEPSTAAAAVA